MNSDEQLEDRLRLLAVPVDPGGVWADIQSRARGVGIAPGRETHTRLRAAVLACVVVIVVAAAAVGGVMYRGNLERTGVYPGGGPVQQPRLLWEFRTPSTTSLPMEYISSPVVSGGAVYFGSQDGYLYAVSLKAGRQNWRFQTGDWVGTPAISDAVVYVGSNDGNLYAVDAKTGRERWRFLTGGPIHTTPAVADGVVYFGSEDGRLYAADAQNGKERWEFEIGGEMYPSQAVSDGVIYVGGPDGRLYGVDLQTGREAWRFNASGPISTCPAVADGVVYFGTWDNLGTSAAYDESGHHLYAVDIKSRREKWVFDPQGVVTDPAIAGGVVVVGSDDGYVYAVDIRTGLEKWKFDAGRGYSGVQSSPAISGEVVHVGSGGTRHCLYALDIDTGRERWRFNTSGVVSSSPAILDGVVYFTDITYVSDSVTNGYLYAVK
jgi:eukaryotic-like serine/threonine-protein kinase